MKKFAAISLFAALGLALSVGAASAASVYDANGAKLDFSFEAAAGYFLVGNANFGAGQDFDPLTGDNKDVEWQEFYMKPTLSGEYSLGTSSLYGVWTAVASKTTGDGDAIAFTDGGDSNVDNDFFYAGWKSGTITPFLGENGLEIYAGQAPIVISDGFIMADGSADGDSNLGGRRPAFWMGPHKGFRRAVVAKLNTSPVRGDLFWFKTDVTQARTEGYGANIEGTIGAYGTLGGLIMELVDSESANRDGMMVYEARYMGNPLADVLEGLYLNFEYANQKNTKGDQDVDAYAWAAEAGYTIANVFAAPTIAYRYTVYSGDDLSTSKDEAYDPLFQTAFGRGWGTWLEGEIMGEYFYINSNKKSHTLIVKGDPMENLSVGLLAFRFYSAEDNVYGTPTTDKHLADELNVYADWSVTDSLLLSAAVGRAWPGDGLKNEGYDDATDLVEVTAFWNF